VFVPDDPKDVELVNRKTDVDKLNLLFPDEPTGVIVGDVPNPLNVDWWVGGDGVLDCSIWWC